MMYLQAPGRALDLHILGYQYADIPPGRWNWYDANWLRIHIRASDEHGVWEDIAPCMLTTDVHRLSAWLRSDLLASDDFVTLEPNISFRRSADDRLLGVEFDLESRPPWSPSDFVGDPYLIEFATTKEELRRAADSLMAEADRFPERSEPSDDVRA